MTELMYLHDSYANKCDSTITKSTEYDGNFLIQLDQTIFYPTGGGQPHDEGTFTKDGVSYIVSAVYKLNGEVFHVVDKAGLKKGDVVHCLVDWPRRYKLMRMHTAAHLISDLLEAEADTKVSSNQLGLEKSRIDFTLENFDRVYLQSFEQKANEIISQALPIKKYFISRQAAESNPSMFTLLKGFPEGIDKVRVVDIEGLDKSACGGTHLDNTKEIKGVKFLKFENKGAQRRRIVFTLVD